MTRSLRRLLVGAAASALLLGPPRPAAAQDYAIASPAGDSLAFALPDLRVMLDTARALYADLEEDPRVLYILGFGPPVTVESPRPAYPWNAVRPQSDSTVNVQTPGNLREADRAYHNYAVMLMREIRGQDPDDPCADLVEREERIVSSFVDGWILARTLFGGPPYTPLDELAFARDAGHLRALLAAAGDASVGACAEAWAEANPAAIEAYETWRAAAFPGLASPQEVPDDAAASTPEADEGSTPDDGR